MFHLFYVLISLPLLKIVFDVAILCFCTSLHSHNLQLTVIRFPQRDCVGGPQSHKGGPKMGGPYFHMTPVPGDSLHRGHKSLLLGPISVWQETCRLYQHQGRVYYLWYQPAQARPHNVLNVSDHMSVFI